MNTLAKVFATAFGAGYSPVAPGTCGTLVAVPLVYAMWWFPHLAVLAVAILVTLLGIWAAGRADKAWGTEDSGRIVIDEVAGYMLTMVPVQRYEWTTLAVGFVLFRLFDIVKPPPVRWIDEKLPGGWGVMLDDVAAGVMAGAVMFALDHFGALAYLAGL